MKPTHLITLSARINELEQLRILNGLSFENFTRLALDANKQAKTLVNIGQFVAAENGIPLEKPKADCNKGNCKGFCPCAVNGDTRTQTYNEAQKSVIFEGWEVIQSNKIHHHNVVNSKLGLQIEFYKEKESLIRIWHRTRDIEYTIIQSLADLAEATTKNPIKLK